jgi:hypothetical protein
MKKQMTLEVSNTKTMQIQALDTLHTSWMKIKWKVKRISRA